MPNERVSMSKLKQLIALQGSNLSVRALSRALGLSVGAVSKYLRAVRGCGISATEAEALAEQELEQRVFGPAPAGRTGAFLPPDCAWMHSELKRHRHVTLQLLWEEYRERHGDGAYRRSAFCPDLPALGEAAEALDAPAALCRREDVRRLRREHGADLRGARRGSLPGAAVRERSRGERPGVRGRHPHPVLAGLVGEPRAGSGILRCGGNRLGAGQSQGRRHACRSL